MKKHFLLVTAVALSLSFFVSCGGGDDADKMTEMEQFQTVIKKSSEEFSQELTQTQDVYNSFDFNNFAENLEVSFSLGDAASDLISSIASSIAPELSFDWLKSVSAGIDYTMKDSSLKVGAKVGVNKTDIITASVTEDTPSSTIFIQIPELFKQNFKISTRDFGFSMKDIMSSYDEAMAVLTTMPELSKFQGLYDEFLNALSDSVTQVSRSKETITAGFGDSKNISKEYTVLSINLDEKTYKSFLKNIQGIVKNSQNLSDILSWAIPYVNTYSDEKISKREFINELSEEIQDSIDYGNFEDSDMILNLYVTEKSEIAGLKLTPPDDDVYSGGIYFAMPKNGDKFGYSLKVVESGDLETGDAVLDVQGYGTSAKGKITGDFTVNYEGDEIVSFETRDLSYEKSLLNGTVIFSPSAALKNEISREVRNEFGSAVSGIVSNLKYSIGFAQKDRNSAAVDFGLLDDSNKPFVTLSAKADVNTKPAKIALPTSDIVNIDEDFEYEVEDLIESLDFSKIIANLRKAKVPDEYVDLIEQVDSDTIYGILDDVL